MNEEQLRALVREAIAQYAGRGVDHRSPSREGGSALPGHSERRQTVQAVDNLPAGRHPSHGLFVLPPAIDSGACVIEPSVRCNHCGYCKSMGH